MPGFLKKKFMDLKIRQKIAISMMGLALATALIVGFLCSASFVKIYSDQSSAQMDNTLDTTISSLQKNLDDMYRNTVYLLSSPLFQNIYRSTEQSSSDPLFLEHYDSAQNFFSSYLRSNNLLDSVVLLCSSGDIYSTYQSGMKYTISNFPDEMKQTSIAWLSARSNPFLKDGPQVIPVCFPLAYQQRFSFSSGKKASMVFVAYLNADRFALSLEQMNRTAFSHVYICDSAGMPLSVKQSDPLYSKLKSAAFRSRLTASKERVHFSINLGDEMCSVATEEVGVNGLRIVSIVTYGKMLRNVKKIQLVTLIAVSLSFLFALMLAVNLSKTITTPIKNLMGQVDKMKSGKYCLKPVTKYGDEIHTLDTALCSMSQTVVEQMKNIQKTEARRRKAEMDAMTEQINPHFLYNTLDSIRWEVLAGKQKSAADMIQSLGAFLRLSLNHGQEMLKLSEEIEHTEQYIKLMNFRFDSRIRFTYTVAPDLSDFMVPKTILQPLAENSILHGFGGQKIDPGVKDPSITISARRKQDQVILALEDNGRGISAEKAKASLHAPYEGENHVGLYNVYHRLLYCFGPKAEIQFFSIPYYKNLVTLILPWQDPFGGNRAQ
jgi:two-component system sensor histidine kinase YesM